MLSIFWVTPRTTVLACRSQVLALRYRARPALVKGISMGLFGTWILGSVIWHFAHGTVPEPATMGAVGGLALIANALSSAREDDRMSL